MGNAGQVTYMEEDGSYNDSITLAPESEVFKKIREYEEKDADVQITVTTAMGESHVTSARIDTRSN